MRVDGELYKLCGDYPPLNIFLDLFDLVGGVESPIVLGSFRVDDVCKEGIYKYFKDVLDGVGEDFSGFIDSFLNMFKKGFKVVGRGRRSFLLIGFGGCPLMKIVKGLISNFLRIHVNHGYIIIPNLPLLLNFIDLLSFGGWRFEDLFGYIIDNFLSDIDRVVLLDSYDKHLFDKYFGEYGFEFFSISEYIVNAVEEENIFLMDFHDLVINVIEPSNKLLRDDYESLRRILSIFPGVDYITSNIPMHSLYCGEWRLLNRYLKYLGRDSVLRCFNKVPHRIVLSVDVYSVYYLYKLFRGYPYVIGSLPQFIYGSFIKG